MKNCFDLQGKPLTCVLFGITRVGLWIYEAVIQLSNGMYVLIYFRLHDSKVSTIVRDWCMLIMQKRVPNVKNQLLPTLVFDSYYSSQDYLQLIPEDFPQIKAIAAISPNRFPDIKAAISFARLEINLLEAFQHEEYEEIFITYEEEGSKLGRKFTWTNAFRVEEGAQDIVYKPVFDDYAVTFNFCDQFNASLHNSTWPHTFGGSGVKGVNGRLHDFAFTVIMKNIYALHLCSSNIPKESVSFQQKLLELADQLMHRSMELEM